MHRASAVHNQGLPGAELVLGQKEKDRPGNVNGLANLSEGKHLFSHFDVLRRCVVVQGGQGQSRGHTVDADIVGTQLVGHGFCHDHNPRLGGAVGHGPETAGKTSC